MMIPDARRESGMIATAGLMDERGCYKYFVTCVDDGVAAEGGAATT